MLEVWKSYDYLNIKPISIKDISIQRSYCLLSFLLTFHVL